jgi:hypothetical protein
MAPFAEFSVLPPLRCFLPIGSSGQTWCGEPALWMQMNESPYRTLFLCDRHHGEVDQPIAGEIIVPRVTFRLDIAFAGVTFIENAARIEAWRRLEGAVERAGGQITIHAASFAIGHWRPPSSRGLGRREPPHP